MEEKINEHVSGQNLRFAPRRVAREDGRRADPAAGQPALSQQLSNNAYYFRQDSTFLYYFGLDRPSLAGVIVKSLRAEGIVSCLKHFPGYGSATVDDHNGTSIVEKTLSELEGCDLVPFQSIIASEGSVPFVMVSHLSYPNVTGSDTPADLSASIVTDILRDKLDYQNVIITDSHSMASITDHYSAGDGAVKALAAGCDMILMPSDLQAAFDAVKAAVADGTLSQARIDESVLRILTVKAEYGIIS